MAHAVSADLLVADEVFLVVADLHRKNPSAEDFSVQQILQHAESLRLTEHLRPGFAVHVRQHCVANLPPNPGKYRVLFATGKARRRLLGPGDSTSPGRVGKIFPDPREVPSRYVELIDWAIGRFRDLQSSDSVYRRLSSMIGTGRGIWSEGADAFVAEQRKDWQ
jgi:hypothetical protein